MAAVHPFRALRPIPSAAARVAAVPYDVVSVEEARALAAGNAQSFLHVSRAEIDLPNEADPYSPAVYERAAANFEALTRSTPFVREAEPSLYVYRLSAGDHVQTGLAACCSLDEYDRDLIKKHEHTRQDKEDDRTRHMLALGAQTGTVFLTYRASPEIDALAERVCSRAPLCDFVAVDEVRHTLWRVPSEECGLAVNLFAGVQGLYIADGHHRVASAARARDKLRRRTGSRNGSGAAGPETFLAVLFPDTQVRIRPYNRTVRDLAGLTHDEFVARLKSRFSVRPGQPTPHRRGAVAMYLGGAWYSVTLEASDTRHDGTDRSRELDVSRLQDRILEPVLKVADVRTDPRVDSVGGGRATDALQARVDSGAAAVAFSLLPVTVDDLMTITDAGGIMPPKSTWFEPKLRDGLLVHVIT